ncbi:hypothetical protein Tco_0667151 [Tanacetum coccineum]
MGSQRSKEDEVQKISTSVFVTNFPDQFNAKDLWNTCKQYGIGSQSLNTEMENKPVLDNSCLNQHDYSNFLMGKVKDFASLSNLKVVLASNDFIIDGRVTWVEIEGSLYGWRFQRAISFKDVVQRIPINKIPSTVLHLYGVRYYMLKSFKVIYQGKVLWVRAKEIPGWVPDFVEDNEEETDTDDEINREESNGEDVELKKFSNWEEDSEVEVVPNSKFEEELPKTNVEEVFVGKNDANSEDPYNLYDLVNKKKDDNNKRASVEDSLKFPLGLH